MSRRAPRPRNVRNLTRAFTVFIAAFAVVISTVTPMASASASAQASTMTAGSVSQAGGDLARSTIVKTSLAGFKPGNIISDDVFTDRGTMSEAQIQSFFNSKVSKCVVGKDEDGKPYVCLKDFKITSVDRQADAYCSGYKGAANESAARIIHRVAQACNINPQVLIVMLQKEQGLVTHVWPSAWRYNIALGQGCPDTAPCDPNYIGFFHQIYGAARQMQIYMEGKYFQWYAPGKTWGILYHPNASCGRGNVYVANKATAALYYYTPYQPNAAALRANYGEGDGCSSYGNRNFYNYFTDWFGSTQSTKCAQPTGGTVATSRAYVVTGANAETRLGPRDTCDEGVEQLEKGAVVQATTVSGSGLWVRIHTSAGYRWVGSDQLRGATAAESACTMPLGTSAAKQTYTIVSETAARLSPRSGCSFDADMLQPGEIFTATEVSGSGLWLRVMTGSGERWLLRSDTRSASSSEKTCTYPLESTEAQFSYVFTKSAATYTAPNTDCDGPDRRIAAGTALQAVNAVDGWLRVETGWGAFWIDRSNTERASAAEAECTMPAGLSPAVKSYRTNGSVTARTAPNSKCTVSSSKIAAGTVLKATAVTADKNWLQVSTAGSSMWVERSDVDYAATTPVCTKPASPAAAQYQYLITKSTAQRSGPSTDCETSGQIAAGTVVQAVNAVDGWLRVETGWGSAWIDRRDTKRASAAESQCVVPAGLKTAVKSYRPSSPITARVAPNSDCTTSTSTIASGTVLKATAVTADGDWLRVSANGAAVWVDRSDVDYATAEPAPSPSCVQPASPTSAKYQYVITKTTAKRASPSTDCAPSGEIAAGALVQAVNAVDGWLKVTADGTDVWINRADTRRATSADLVCSSPAGVKPAKLDYLVTGSTTTRTGPSADCAGTSDLAAGTVFAADGVSADGKWLRTKAAGSAIWVLRAETDVYTAGQSSCAPAKVGADAKLWYRASEATGRSVPDDNCGYGAVAVAEGTVVQGESVSADGKWLSVTVDGAKTWLLRSGLTKVTSKQTTASLNLRSEPRLDASVIVTLSSGTWIAVLESSGDWRKVQTLSGQGWVNAEYLR